MTLQIDINCDMGESFGLYTYGHDANMLPLISSANVACGFHAGDPTVMRNTVAGAKANKVKVGAHVGFPDRMGFGRRNMQIPPLELKDHTMLSDGGAGCLCESQGAGTPACKTTRIFVYDGFRRRGHGKGPGRCCRRVR